MLSNFENESYQPQTLEERLALIIWRVDDLQKFFRIRHGDYLSKLNELANTSKALGKNSIACEYLNEISDWNTAIEGTEIVKNELAQIKNIIS